MDYSMTKVVRKSKLMHSEKAEEGAASLVRRIDSGDMAMQVLPNNYAQFTGELEEKDYISYCNFLNSRNGRTLIRMLEECDERKLSEL